MKRKIGLYLALLAMISAFSCANQTGTQDDSVSQLPKIQEQPTELQEFVNETASEGIMQVSMVRIAINRSEDFEIDQLAETMRLDHQSAGTELKSIAASKGWTIPVTMTDTHQRKADRLQSTDAAAFDEEFLKVMISIHEDAIIRFEKCAEKENDQQIISWIKKRLPVLQQHLEHCKELSGRLAEGS